VPSHKDRYQIIEKMKDRYPITWLTQMAQLHRSGYYNWFNSKSQINVRTQKDEAIKQAILEIHQKHRQYGYPRVTFALREQGFLVNHKKVYRLMCELNVHSIIRKKRRFFKGNYSRSFPNVVNRKFQDRQQNEVLVTDITYLPYKSGFLYLSAIQDLYNNEIVAWKIGKRNDLQLVLDTLEIATQK